MGQSNPKSTGHCLWLRCLLAGGSCHGNVKWPVQGGVGTWGTQRRSQGSQNRVQVHEIMMGHKSGSEEGCGEAGCCSHCSWQSLAELLFGCYASFLLFSAAAMPHFLDWFVPVYLMISILILVGFGACIYYFEPGLQEAHKWRTQRPIMERDLRKTLMIRDNLAFGVPEV